MSVLKGTYDKDLYDKIGKFYNTYNTYNALVKFKGSDKEYIIQSIKTADPRWVFCTINGLGQFCKDITKITFLNRKAVDYFANIKEGINEPHDAASNPDVKLKQAIVQRYKELTLANREGSSIYKTLEKEFGNQIPLENIVSLVSNIKIRESNQKNITDIIKQTVKEYKNEHSCSLWDINNGLCLDFASDIIEKMGGYSDILFELSDEMFFSFRDPDFARENWKGNLIETPYGVWSDQMLKLYDTPPIDLQKVDDEGSHVWIYYNGKHYDAEAPQGVNKWYELPLIKKWFAEYNPKKEMELKENYSAEQVKDLLWNHFKDKASNILFKGQEENSLVFEVHVENNMTWDEMNEMFGELEESEFFDCVLQADNKTLTVKYLGPIKNSIMEKSKKAIDQAILEAKLVFKLEELTGKGIRLIESTEDSSDEDSHDRNKKAFDILKTYKPGDSFAIEIAGGMVRDDWDDNSIELGGILNGQAFKVEFNGYQMSRTQMGNLENIVENIEEKKLNPEQIDKFVKHLIRLLRNRIDEVEESFLNEIASTGEYSVEEMNKFIQTLLSTISWGEGPTINIPSNWPASTVCSDKHSIVDVWGKAQQKYPNAKWYVWKADLSGNKPIQLASQKLDINNILQIISEHPEAYKSLSIGVDNEQTDRFANDLSTQGD